MRFSSIGGHELLKIFSNFFIIYVRRVSILFILSNLSQAHLITFQVVQKCKVYMWVKNCLFGMTFYLFVGLVIDCSKKIQSLTPY